MFFEYMAFPFRIDDLDVKLISINITTQTIKMKKMQNLLFIIGLFT